MIYARIGVAPDRGSVLWGSVLVALVSAGVLVTVAGMLVAIGDRSCAPSFSGAGCASLRQAFAPWEQAAQAFMALLWIVPTGLGALLGVAITAGELERRSAQVSWTLSPSRIRWLLLRAIPIGLVLLVMLSVAAGAAEVATRGRLLTDALGFHDYQLRSVLVPARGLLAFAIALAIGLVFGRTLPALLVALVFGGAVTGGVLVLVDAWHVTSASFLSLDDPMLQPASYPLVATPSSLAGADGRGILVISATEYWPWVLRETGLFLLASALAAVAAGSFLRRRVP